ncbi:MAG: VOC family protein [Gemmatimonadota bacterium]
MTSKPPAQILGLHHVTATVDEAQPDVDFAAGVLAMRLVKKTINFDNRRVYHFYYGDHVGSPGTLWTTFPYHGMGVREGVKGAGQVTATAFSIPRAAAAGWTRRLMRAGLQVDQGERFGEPVLSVRDPSGVVLELIATTETREHGMGVGENEAVCGLHSVTLSVAEPAPTVDFLGEVLGFATHQREAERERLTPGGAIAGASLDVTTESKVRALNGIGTVHHVALAVGSDEEQLALREHLVSRGVSVTPVMDRCYFRSIYFREPGGVLLEVATVAPGFTVDEPVERLGRGLMLPPWEEPARASIEGALPRVHVPAQVEESA